jgi:hypothetical protein
VLQGAACCRFVHVMARLGAGPCRVLTACTTASEQTTSKPGWPWLRPFARRPGPTTGRRTSRRLPGWRSPPRLLSPRRTGRGRRSSRRCFRRHASHRCCPIAPYPSRVPLSGSSRVLRCCATSRIDVPSSVPSTGCRLVSVYMSAKSRHRALAVPLGRPAFSGQLNWCYFTLRAAGSGTRCGLLAESDSRVPSEAVSDCSAAQCNGQCPASPFFSSGKQYGGPALLSVRH